MSPSSDTPDLATIISQIQYRCVEPQRHPFGTTRAAAGDPALYSVIQGYLAGTRTSSTLIPYDRDLHQAHIHHDRLRTAIVTADNQARYR